ncbi:MAG TPA: hypothetical protein VK602_13775 [Phyllobacterium sp.]|nr:hypothetical protein [Phyllobacterium sp.]
MDYQSVASPTNYGAPSVSGILNPQPAQGQQGQQQPAQQDPALAALAKAKQLLSSGQITSDQYSALSKQLTGAQGMPGATGAPMNLAPPGAMAPAGG